MIRGHYWHFYASFLIHPIIKQHYYYFYIIFTSLFQLHQVFTALLRQSLAAASRGYAWSPCVAFSLRGFSRCGAQARGVWASAGAVHGPSSCGSPAPGLSSVTVVHGLRCSVAYGLFPNQDRTHVPCTGRRSLIPCAIREVLSVLLDMSSGSPPGLIFVCKGHSTAFGGLLVIAAEWVEGQHWPLEGRGQGATDPTTHRWPHDRGRASPSVGGAVPERPHLGSGPTRQTKQQKHSSVYCVFAKYIHTGPDECKCFTDLVFFSICCCCLIGKLVWLFETLDCSPPGSSVHGISQARMLEWVGICFSWGSSQPKDGTCICCLGRQVLYC